MRHYQKENDYSDNCRALLIAIIHQAVKDSVGVNFNNWWSNGRKRKQLKPETFKETSDRMNALARKKALQWITDWAQSDYDVEFTFPWICDCLGVCAESTKNRLVRLIKTPKFQEVGHDSTVVERGHHSFAKACLRLTTEVDSIFKVNFYN